MLCGGEFGDLGVVHVEGVEVTKETFSVLYALGCHGDGNEEDEGVAFSSSTIPLPPRAAAHTHTIPSCCIMVVVVLVVGVGNWS